MSRTLGGPLTTYVAAGAKTPARMLRLDLRDGGTLAITDHSADIAFDLGDGSVTYSPRTGILPSDLSLSTGFDADEVEITGPLVETATEDWHVTKAMVLGGRFDDATVRFFEVNWRDLTMGAIKLMRGIVYMANVEGSTFKLSIRSEISRFSQEIGRTITAYCDADFGDTRCGYVITPLSATITAVTSEREFTVSFTGTYADNFFNRGTVTFTSGALAGTRPVEVFDWSAAGQVATYVELVALPEIGDTLELRQGCGKTRTDCIEYANIVNFRGFPDVPGTDQVLRYPNPQ